MSVDSRFHNCWGERFVDVVHSSNLKSFRLFVALRLPSKENHRYVPRLWCGFQDSAQFVAVHPWHRDVQQDQVWLLFVFYQGQGLGTAGRNSDLEVVLQDRMICMTRPLSSSSGPDRRPKRLTPVRTRKRTRRT